MNYESISMLERYGENLTKNEYITDPAIAREDETMYFNFINT